MKRSLLPAFCFFCLTLLPSLAMALGDHGISLHGNPKYSATDLFLAYVNPNAPKGGELRLGAIGTFDTTNPYTLKGISAANASMVFDTLMESTLDEPFSEYGLVAEGITVSPSKDSVSFTIRPIAKFHDGSPITAEDVVFSFNTLRDKGNPFYKSYYNDVEKVEATGPTSVTFTFKKAGNSELPLIIGQMPILSKAFWEGKDFSKTILSPVMGSGPYRIESISAGRSITYSRIKDWWGENLFINKGRYNFDKIRIDYYRDATIATEAFLSGQYDFRLENIAKSWATAYDTPDVQSGNIKREEVANELPAGMQGFVFNTRREIFKDRRVREAIGLAFDFEWSNKTLAYDAYTRTNSYFANSELASSGPITPEERKILAPYRRDLPPEVFNATYAPPVTDGSGLNRDNLRKAKQLLEDAGWKMKDGKLLDSEGKEFAFEILDNSPLFERWTQPFIRNLERLGINARLRVTDSSQYQNMLNDFDFDMTIKVFPQSLTPGNEQRDYWTSEKANVKGSSNLIGLQNPVIDALVDKIIQAKSREELVTLCRALDRVLLWGYYVIPHWNIGKYRIAYWDIFGKPDVYPKYGLDTTSVWWIDPEKQQALFKDAQKAHDKEINEPQKEDSK